MGVALLVILGVGFLLYMFTPFSDKLTEPLTILTYNNAYYELADKNYLKKLGLKNEIKATDLGDMVLTINQENLSAPDLEAYLGGKVYTYKPVDGKGLLIVEKQGAYQPFIFCNFLKGEYPDKQRVDAIENMEVLGINSPSDIIKVEILDPYSKTIFGNPKKIKEIMDPETITKIYLDYKKMKDLTSYIFDIEVKKCDSGRWKGDTRKHTNDKRDIKLYLKNGLYTKLSYYPTISFIEDRMSYYRVDKKETSFWHELTIVH